MEPHASLAAFLKPVSGALWGIVEANVIVQHFGDCREGAMHAKELYTSRKPNIAALLDWIATLGQPSSKLRSSASTCGDRNGDS